MSALSSSIPEAVDSTETEAVAGTCLPPEAAPETVAERLVEQDLLVEDVSIDGMCGVY